MNTRLILASQSAGRRAMLQEAGIPFEAREPGIEEEPAKEALIAKGAAAPAIAEALAELKTVVISAAQRDVLVLGSDQVLVCEGRFYNKARTRTEARATLESLRGRTHRLVSAAVLSRNGKPVWRHWEAADMTMRDFSDAFLDDYLEQEGDGLLGSVGCYRIEGLGAQLFARVEGDHFVIRGMPLLPLLEALRREGGLRA